MVINSKDQILDWIFKQNLIRSTDQIQIYISKLKFPDQHIRNAGRIMAIVGEPCNADAHACILLFSWLCCVHGCVYTCIETDYDRTVYLLTDQIIASIQGTPHTKHTHHTNTPHTHTTHTQTESNVELGFPD